MPKKNDKRTHAEAFPEQEQPLPEVGLTSHAASGRVIVLYSKDPASLDDFLPSFPFLASRTLSVWAE